MPARVLTRSIVTAATLRSSKSAELDATDWLFSDNGPFGPDRQCPHWKFSDLGDAIPFAPNDVRDLGIPILVGELSDEGAKDPHTGHLVEKGRLPGFYLGRFNLDPVITPHNNLAQYLVAAGGGGYGSNAPNLVGGGGGGSVRTGAQALAVGSYAITVGAAGSPGTNGGDSSALGVTAVGGGYGGRDFNQDHSATAAGSGGNGGGAGNAQFLGVGATSGDLGRGPDWQSQTPGVSTDHGHDGGRDHVNASGGGGGAGGPGGDATQNNGGAGGPGVPSDITGALAYYGAGGAGCGLTSDGHASASAYGGGGYGGWRNPATAAQPGVVVVRYPTGTITATGGTMTTVDGWTIHSFTASGTLTVTAVATSTSPAAADSPGQSFDTMLAALQASYHAGTLVADYGSIIGAGNATTLQGLAELPNTYTKLSNVIGYQNVDALLAQGVTSAHDAGGGDGWGFIAFGLGAWYRYISIFGSDLGGGIAENKHDRTKLDLSHRIGSDLFVPGYDGWPYPSPYVQFLNDQGELFCLTGIFVRGPLLDDHINGTVNITANAIGAETVGDGSGLPIMRVADIEQFLYENHFINLSRGGLWATATNYPTFSDGTPILKTSTFRAFQQFTKDALGGEGLIGCYYSDTEQQATTDVVVDFMRNTESRTGVNGDGQFVKFWIDESLDPADWPILEHELDVYGEIIRTSGEERENVVQGCGDWDPDKGVATIPTITIEDAVAIMRNRKIGSKGRKLGELITNKLLRSVRELTWVLTRRLARLKYGMVLVEVTGPIDWLDYDVGQGVRFNSPEGPGDGYVDHPMIILRRSFDMATRAVTLTLWDVRTVLLNPDGVTTGDGASLEMLATDDATSSPYATDDDTTAPVTA